MWYVLQVPTGREDRLIEEIRSYRIQEYFEEVFAPRSVRKKKYRGKWQTSEELLFPGYLFVISENPEELYQALKRIPRMTRILGTGEKWTAMTANDIETVRRLAAPHTSTHQEKWLMDFSEGYLQGDKIIVTEGPLQGMESHIRRIDRHKRLAWLSVDILGEPREIAVGLEIIRKE